MDALLKDLKHSARMFLRAPAFTITAIATLALGIAANTAIFSVLNTVLLKPFSYPDPERIVMFQNTFRDGVRSGSASPVEFNWWRQYGDSFEYISAYEFNVANWTGESLPEQIPAMDVSAEFLRLCGANALLGRVFAAEDDLPNAARTAVLAYGFWQRQFGGNRRVIGGRITLNGERYEIIGVLGPNLNTGQIAEQSLGSGDIEINQPPDVYLPFQLDPHSAERGHYFNVAGRLKPGVTLAIANARLQAGYPEYARRWPDLTTGASFGVQPLQDAIVGGVRSSLLILLGAVGLVLVIACVNVAHLQLARATGRKREIAIRAAVGAGRRRIARQLLTESLLLSLAGSALGLTTGYAGIRAILVLVPDRLPRIGPGGSNISLDWRVLAFTLAVSMVTSILFGLVPALQSSRADLSTVLKQGGNRSGTGLRQERTRALLVTTEVALTLALLIGAALLVRSYAALRQVDTGFDAHNVLTMRMSLKGAEFTRPAAVAQVIRDGVRRIRALPGVEAAAAACCVPLEDRLRTVFQIEGRPEGATSQAVAGWTLVSPGYFETFRIPVLRGRAFTDEDDSGPPVVIINQTLAKRFWPNRVPLNDRIVIGHDSPRQIIGVAGDVRDDSLDRDPRPNVYVLSAQLTGGQMVKVLQNVPWAWVIRTRAAPLRLSSAIQNELREASGGLPVADVRTMEETLSRSTATESFRTLVLTIFAGSALLLAVTGIYGLLAYSVAQRLQEIGIRIALGAESRQIRNMLVYECLRPALTGVLLGLAGAFGLRRTIAGFLFGVKPWDPMVFFAVPAILVAVALVVVWVPAMRASRVDPIRVLRYE